MSSQSVTMPCSIGYLIFSNPLNSCAFLPMKTSPSKAPAMTLMCFGRPTLKHHMVVSSSTPRNVATNKDGKKHLGWSCPANPALIVPDPCTFRIRVSVSFILRWGKDAHIVYHYRLICEHIVVFRHSPGVCRRPLVLGSDRSLGAADGDAGSF